MAFFKGYVLLLMTDVVTTRASASNDLPGSKDETQIDCKLVLSKQISQTIHTLSDDILF